MGGLLMLGREEAIRERLPHWHLSYRELPSDSSTGQRWSDRVASDGTWNANVFEFYSRIIVKLHEGLKVPFALDAGQFRQDETPAHQALREALVNTLIHADYEGPAGIRILRDPSGYEFVNPGLLLVSLQQLWRGGVSESRNPVLQRLFSLIQLGEREGSGGPAIRQAWVQQHWRAPDLTEDVENSESHLKLQQLSLLPPVSVEALRDQLGAQFEGQDELGRLALVTAHAEGGFTHARLAALTNLHTRDVTLKIQELLRKRLLVSAGPARTKTYALAADATSMATRPQDNSSAAAAATTPIGQSIGQSMGQNPRQSLGPNPSGPQQGTPPRGWAPLDTQSAAVLEFCHADWRIISEIAQALGRTEETVRKRYLPPLVEQGDLERRYPDNPRHPLQAYRTTKK